MNALIPFDVETQKTEAAKLVESAGLSTLQLAVQKIEVIDDDSYTAIIDIRGRFATAEKKIFDFFEPLTKAANALHKALTGARAEMAKPYTDGKELATKKAERFLMEQKKAKALAEEQLKRMAKTEQVNLQDKASDLESQGYMKEAERMRQQATMTVAPQLPSAIPVAAGARVGDKFTGTVVDLMAILKSIADGKTELMWEVNPGDLRPLVVIDQVVLNAIVKRLQAGLRIPGILIEEGVRISSARKP